MVSAELREGLGYGLGDSAAGEGPGAAPTVQSG